MRARACTRGPTGSLSCAPCSRPRIPGASRSRSMTRLPAAGNLPPMSSYDELLKVTCELLRRHIDPSREIRPSDRIQDDLGLDSLSVMELASDVEARFGVSIPSE